MQYANTSFGRIPLPDEYIPRREWDGYIAAAKNHAQKMWQLGTPSTPLGLAEARQMESFNQPKRKK